MGCRIHNLADIQNTKSLNKVYHVALKAFRPVHSNCHPAHSNCHPEPVEGQTVKRFVYEWKFQNLFFEKLHWAPFDRLRMTV